MVGTLALCPPFRFGVRRTTVVNRSPRPVRKIVSNITIIYSPKPVENPPVIRPTTALSNQPTSLVVSSSADIPPVCSIIGRRIHVEAYCSVVRRRVRRAGTHRHNCCARLGAGEDRDGRRCGDV